MMKQSESIPAAPAPSDRRAELLARLSRFELTASAEGAYRLPISLAGEHGIRIDVVTRSEALFGRMREYFDAHIGLGPADCEVLAEPLPSPSLWEDVDPEFDVRGNAVIQRDFVARRLGRASLSAQERVAALVAPGLDDSFHNLLRWVAPPLLLGRQAFLLHGAAVVRDGRGYVFFGHSEAGKSTSVGLISRSDPSAILLGDDGVLIRMVEGIPWVHAAPLGCGYSRLAPPAVGAPLDGLFTLRQDRKHRIEPLPAGQGTAQLLASVMNVDFDEDAPAKIDLATRFALSSCGVRRLRFSKDAGFWPLVLADSATRSRHSFPPLVPERRVSPHVQDPQA